MAGPSNINKPYAEASHEGDGVPAKAKTVNQPSHIEEKKESLRSLHRDPSHSPEAISNRATSGKSGGSGTSNNYGKSHSSIAASHGAGGQGNNSSSFAGDAEQPEPPLSPSLVSSKRLV
ncbi:hypothetical protein BDZ90DRAFT_257275 [Jaminaea rosea]|uniref:Uncharacterized protein n=1 Tax=Jaminaea rosea TaxID=1569628 RepID=A0A316UY93_9BASI|nr:hypothetical protein BDZ90DRAFT_257275 [Jaminaea rosea]PWN30182.1 hypothetical protein BDZ90DRAFT_257275 [Jaminaea rosea]